ncbi:MAG: serine/threonine-protein kinase [Bryobacteraceae bacterium]|jgi:serine/threonine-protein kinase
MIGTQIGNYRILEKIDEGGMGVVYKAVDVNLDRTVAIQALSTELSGNSDLEQAFRTEIKALANLSHTNLATLYALFIENGRPLLVWEFVEGETFPQMLRRRGPIPSEEAISLFRQALAGVGYAHRMGIVHRDIQPGNIMLNGQGIVKVMDCGIAKALSARGVAKSGVRIGNPLYMSPEQFLNRGVDFRSDVYSLGVTLYEMLTGKPPFSADSDYQIMADHVNTPPPPLTSIFPYVPKGVESAVLKALEKNPEARYQSVEEFGAALDGALGLAVPAPAASARPAAAAAAATASTFFTPGRRALAAGLAALLALAGFVLSAFPGARHYVARRLTYTISAPAQTTDNAATTPNGTPAAPGQPDNGAAPPLAGAAPDGTVAPGVAVVPAQPGVGVAVAPAQPDTAAPADNNAGQGPLVIPAGTVVAVRLSDPVDSSMNQVGDKFAASVDAAVNVNGTEAIPAGADASVSLINLAIAPVAARTDVQLQLVSVSINGTDYTPRTSVFEKQSIERSKKKVIAGAAIGATIGGIFGHGQGAAGGAAAGAAKPYVIVIPAQTRIKFTLRRSITLSQ